MVAQTLTPEVHPLDRAAACLREAEEALAKLPDGPLPPAEAHALEEVVESSTRVERKAAEFRLRASCAAEESGAAATTGATDTGAWLARLTGSSAAVMRGGLWLARLLQERYPSVREAFASGGLGEEHARMIVRAAERMPREVTDDDRQEAVSALVEATVQRRLDLKALRRQARRMLDRINREYADRHEATLVAEEEHVARNETWMALDDNGDGTWTGRFVLLELGEHLPTDGLAQHGRVGATIAVHIDHQHLLDGLAAAHLDTGSDISVGEARRLACQRRRHADRVRRAVRPARRGP